MRPEDVPDDITPAEVAALGGLAAADAELALEPVGPRVPAFGSRVLCGGHAAKVLAVHRDGDPDSAVDLVIQHGSAPEVRLRQPHSAASGWCWADEVPAPPPSLEDQLRSLAASGVRIPRVGATVLCVRSNAAGELPYFARRARVVALKGVYGPKVALDLECFVEPDPPADSRDPDPTSEYLRSYNLLGPLGPGDRAEGWAWPGWTSPPPLSADEMIPKLPCTRCGAPYPHTRRVELKASGGPGRWRDCSLERSSRPVAALCPGCADEVLTFATTPTGPAEVA